MLIKRSRCTLQFRNLRKLLPASKRWDKKTESSVSALSLKSLLKITSCMAVRTEFSQDTERMDQCWAETSYVTLLPTFLYVFLSGSFYNGQGFSLNFFIYEKFQIYKRMSIRKSTCTIIMLLHLSIFYFYFTHYSFFVPIF